MTEEELIKDIIWKIQKYPYNPKFEANAREIVMEIVKTFREAGWKSPEEVKYMKDRFIHDLARLTNKWVEEEGEPK